MPSRIELMFNNVETIGKFLTLYLGSELYAISIDDVEEVLPTLPLESVPQSPSFMRGVVFVRGELIPVIDTAERFGIKNHQRSAEPRIVCLRLDQRMVGVEFDDAIDIIDLSAARLLDANRVNCAKGFLKGVLDHEGSVIRILDPQQLISLSETRELDSAI